jgi:hypothetical protein
MAGSQERVRETKEEDDGWGQRVSEREGERTRGWAARCWAARARASASAGAMQLGRAVGPSRREKGGVGPIGNFVFLFQKCE